MSATAKEQALAGYLASTGWELICERNGNALWQREVNGVAQVVELGADACYSTAMRQLARHLGVPLVQVDVAVNGKPLSGLGDDMLTERQFEMVGHIKRIIAERGHGPTPDELQAMMGYTTSKGSRSMLTRLEQLGYVLRPSRGSPYVALGARIKSQ